MRIEVKYGLITGVGVSAWVLLEYLLGFHTANFEIGKYSGYFSSIIPIITIYLCIKQKRDKTLNGIIGFKQALRSGLIVSVIAASIITTFFIVYNTYINPGWMDIAMEWEKQNMLKQGIELEKINKKVNEYKALSTPLAQFIQNFFGILTSGTIISILIAFVLRKKTPQTS